MKIHDKDSLFLRTDSERRVLRDALALYSNGLDCDLSEAKRYNVPTATLKELKKDCVLVKKLIQRLC